MGFKCVASESLGMAGSGCFKIRVDHTARRFVEMILKDLGTHKASAYVFLYIALS